MTKFQNINNKVCLENLDFGFVSDFDIWISDL